MVEVDNFLPILTIILFLMTIVSILIFNFDFLQPVVIVNAVMTVSLFLGVLNIVKWNLFVGSYTTIIFMAGVMAFSGGGIFAQHNYFHCRTTLTKIQKKKYEISPKIILIITAFILLLAYLNCNEMYELSIELGNHGGLSNMIKTLRYPIERGEITFSRWSRYENLVAMSFATVFLYVFIYKIIFERKKLHNQFVYLLPVIAVIPFFLLSTGRRTMVHFILSSCIFTYILYQQRFGYNRFVRLRLIKILGIAGLFAILFYFLMGFLTDKVQIGGRSPITIIAHYGGLSVPALDQFLNNTFVENQYIGQNTLMGFYGNLNTLGFHLERGKDFLPFVSFTGTDTITTNVYTVLYRLIADWSFPGMLIVMFLFGVFLTLCYDYLKYHTKPIMLILYAYFGYIPFFLFIDDQFMTLFKTDNLYFAVLSLLITKIVEKDPGYDSEDEKLCN